MKQSNFSILDKIEDMTPESKVVAYRGVASAALTRAIYAVNSYLLYDQASEAPTLDERNEADQRGNESAPYGLEPRESNLDRALRWSRLYLVARDRNMTLAQEDSFLQADTVERRIEFLVSVTPRTTDTVQLAIDALQIDDPELKKRIEAQAAKDAMRQQARLEDNAEAVIDWIEGLDVPENVDMALFSNEEHQLIATKALNEVSSRFVWCATKRNLLGTALLLKESMNAIMAWMKDFAKSA